MGLSQRWRFLKGFLRRPHKVGAIAPSSAALASALCEPFRRHPRPASILEVGAGTGAITKHLGTLLGDRDRLDVCEVEPSFVEVLRRDVLSHPDFRPAVDAGRVKLLQTAVQELPSENRYDFIISGLPLNAFELSDVEDVFAVLRRSLKPGGVLSYFEYIGMRATSRMLALGRRRRRIRSVSKYMTGTIRKHQFDKRTVLKNLPPAYTRYLRFDA